MPVLDLFKCLELFHALLFETGVVRCCEISFNHDSLDNLALVSLTAASNIWANDKGNALGTGLLWPVDLMNHLVEIRHSALVVFDFRLFCNQVVAFVHDGISQPILLLPHHCFPLHDRAVEHLAWGLKLKEERSEYFHSLVLGNLFEFTLFCSLKNLVVLLRLDVATSDVEAFVL